MSDIEKAVQAAIEEFGDCAHKCFEYADVGWSNCSFNGYLSPDCFILRQKPLYELFSHDFTVYGDKAYLMWQWQYKDCEKQGDWLDCDKPPSWKPSLNYRRKESATLPFDIERAKSGDAIMSKMRFIFLLLLAMAILIIKFWILK